MKPTISNAFNDGSIEPASNISPLQGPMDGSIKNPSNSQFNTQINSQLGGRFPHDPSELPPDAVSKKRRNPSKSLAGSLSPMQVDLRETNFGWSLDLSPMQAIDALQALSITGTSLAGINFLVSLEQSAWRDGDQEMPIAEIVQRLAIPVLNRIAVDLIVMDANSLLQLVSLCQPSRLVAVAVDGEVDERDADAITHALEGGLSPLVAEIRALAALEVLGDRSLVLHCRDKDTALRLVADNFRHYLAAVSNRSAATYEAPDASQIERLLSLTGMITIRPIETQRFSTSIDVGINTTKERFSQPADKSLIYDIPSNSWHDEP